MSRKWTYRDISNTLLEFSRQNETIYIPKCIGKRYVIDGILSAEGGFGLIFTAKDSRLSDRKVLVKARRYDRESGLWAEQHDISRNKRIENIREQIWFEFDCLVNFRKYQEARIPNLNDVVFDFSPALNGPHKDRHGTTYYYEDPLIREEPYLILQNIEGENLLDHLADHFSEKHWEKFVLDLSKELCTILGGFHSPEERNSEEEYFIYQDLKPSNIMVSHETFVTLIDLGGMTFRDSDGKTELENHGTGTWGYMPPETDPARRMLNDLDVRADIFTLGATMFHLLTKEDPAGYPQYPVYDVKRLHDMRRYHKETIQVVEKATQQDRKERYEIVREMRSDINRAVSSLSRV